MVLETLWLFFFLLREEKRCFQHTWETLEACAWESTYFFVCVCGKVGYNQYLWGRIVIALRSQMFREKSFANPRVICMLLGSKGLLELSFLSFSVFYCPTRCRTCGNKWRWPFKQTNERKNKLLNYLHSPRSWDFWVTLKEVFRT